MKPVVVEVVFMLVLGFFFRKSKSDNIDFTASCNNSSTMSVTCSYNGQKTLDGLKLHVDGLLCETFKYTSDGLCPTTGVKTCSDFTHKCPDKNSITLTVKNIQSYAERENGQNLTCQPLSNNKATSEKTISLQVHPTLDTSLVIENNISTKRDENIHLQIKVVALPLPNFTWFQKREGNWHSISSHANKNVTSTKLESKLTIFRVLPTDEGWYKVKAENDCGKVEQQYHVQVEGGNDSRSKNLLPYIAAGGGLLVLVIVVVLSVKLCHCRKEDKSVPEPRQLPLPRKSVEPHYCTIVDSETDPLANNSTNLNHAVSGSSVTYPSTSNQSHILKNGVEYAVVNKKGKGKGKSMGSQKKFSAKTDEDALKYIELSFKGKKDDKVQYVNHVHGRAETVAYAEVKRRDTSL